MKTRSISSTEVRSKLTPSQIDQQNGQLQAEFDQLYGTHSSRALVSTYILFATVIGAIFGYVMYRF